MGNPRKSLTFRGLKREQFRENEESLHLASAAGRIYPARANAGSRKFRGGFERNEQRGATLRAPFGWNDLFYSAATGFNWAPTGRPNFSRSFISISSARSGLSRRNCLELSRP